MPRFHSYFLFRKNGNREQLDENNLCRCYGSFFQKCYSKVLDWSYVKVFFQELRGTLTTVFERQVTIKDFTDMD